MAWPLVFFWVGNMGTRLIAIKRIKRLSELSWEEIFMATVIAAGLAIPMFFLQRGTPWNTIQFFYYSLFFSGILAGVVVSQIKNNFMKIIIILLTIPTVFGTLKHYLPARPPAKLSHEELEALSFLSRQPRGVVLTYPFDKSAADAAIPLHPAPWPFMNPQLT